MSLSVQFDVLPCPPGRPSGFILELERADTYTVSDLLHDCRCLEKSKRGAWLVAETWKTCRKTLSPQDNVFILGKEWGSESDGQQCGCARFQLQEKQKKSRKPRKEARTKRKAALISQPKLFLKKPTHKRLYCTKWVIEQALRQSKKKYSNLLLNRIIKRDPLWGPVEATPLDSLQTELNLKKARNLELSSEIADLNITSTRLRNETHTLRQKEQELKKKLTKLQHEVSFKREEKDRRGPKDLSHVQTDIIRLKRELETRNRLNASYTSKLKVQKELLSEKKSYLEQRQKEFNDLKRAPVTTTPIKKAVTSSKDFGPPVDQISQHSFDAEKRDPKLSTTAKKRHASKFEAKTKQLVEEEGMSFRKMQSQMKFEPIDPSSSHSPSSKSSAQTKSELGDEVLNLPQPVTDDLQSEGPDVLIIPKEDKMWFMSDENIPSHSKISKQNKNHKVRFAKEALILNAALEGEMDVLKDCIKELGSCSQVSDKGATCLHNAVCSGNMEMVEFLVEMGCNINAQDIDGWTPLHCAAAYCNLSMIQYLIENGGSLFMGTKDGETPLKIAAEESEVQRLGKDGEKETNQAAIECLHYLMDCETNLGVSDGAKVYALFSRHTSEPDELSFIEGELLVISDRGGRGEQWWSAVNTAGQRGLVPCTFLGPQCRHSVVL